MATAAAINTANMLNDNMVGGVEGIEIIDMNATPKTFLENKVSNVVDDIADSHSFIKNVMHNGRPHSPQEMLKVQEAVEKFTLSTQLASKFASTFVKNVDTLTKIQ